MPLIDNWGSEMPEKPLFKLSRRGLGIKQVILLWVLNYFVAEVSDSSEFNLNFEKISECNFDTQDS